MIPKKFKCKCARILRQPIKTAAGRKKLIEEFDELVTAAVDQPKLIVALWREKYDNMNCANFATTPRIRFAITS